MMRRLGFAKGLCAPKSALPPLQSPFRTSRITRDQHHWPEQPEAVRPLFVRMQPRGRIKLYQAVYLDILLAMLLSLIQFLIIQNWCRQWGVRAPIYRSTLLGEWSLTIRCLTEV